MGSSVILFKTFFLLLSFYLNGVWIASSGLVVIDDVASDVFFPYMNIIKKNGPTITLLGPHRQQVPP